MSEKSKVANFRFTLLKDGRINTSFYEKHIEVVFEPRNKRHYTIIRIYSYSGSVIKQWKGIGFGKACRLGLAYLNSVCDNVEICENGIQFLCENGEELISCTDNQRSIYSLFPSLPKYNYQ